MKRINYIMLKVLKKKKTTVLKIIGILGLMCLLFLAAVKLSAESLSVYEVNAQADTEYAGYLFKLNDGAELDIDAADIEVVNESQNLYSVSTIDDIKDCIDNEADIEYIEPDYVCELIGDAVQKVDFAYIIQGNLVGNRAIAILNSDLSAEGAVVGIIDTGLYTDHEAIDVNNVVEGKNYASDDSNTNDAYGHGTAVTSVVAANSSSLLSLGYGASIVPLKVLDSSNRVSLSYVLRAIYDAVDVYHCDAVNMSMSCGNSKLLEEACQYAYNNGTIIVAATGNFDTNEKIYPAGFDTVIGVGSTSGKFYYYNHNDSIFVVASSDIRVAGIRNSSDYMHSSGTSLSAPSIVALVALARAYNPSITFEEVKDLLKNSAVDMGDPGYDEYYGWGYVDCCDYYYNLTGKETEPFIDVASNYWGAQAIGYCYRNYIINGTTDITYTPENNISRCDFMTLLGRMYESEAGSLSDYECSFSDVPDGKYYTEYVAWAEYSGIVDGNGDGTFTPQKPITREQAATILYRYKEYTGLKAQTADMSALDKYEDSSLISAYALAPMAWAVQNGIYKGTSLSVIDPNANLTRAMGASVVSRTFA